MSVPPSAERMTAVASSDHAAKAAKTGAARDVPAARARWTVDAVEALFALPFTDLLHRAQASHREHHAPDTVQLSTLLSIKTGGCSEDCGYCPQAARHHTGVGNEALLAVDEVVAAARAAKAAGASRFCMGAAWRGPKDRDLAPVLDMVRAVKAEGLETCCTLGMLKDGQAQALRDAGLDYYNHNLDTAPEFYGDIVTTRDYRDRLDTLERVPLLRKARPQFRQRRAEGRVAHARRHLGRGTEHVRAAHEVRPRQHEPRLIADTIAVEQDVEIHGTRRPLRRQPLAAAQRLRVVQVVDHGVHVVLGVDGEHEVHEVLALEAHRPVAVRGRAAQRGIAGCERAERAAQVGDRLDVAAGRDQHRGHAPPAPPA